MSYAQISPQVYEVYQPDGTWEIGAPGWTNAPFPGWGQNPNLLDRHRMAVQGLGCGGGCGCNSGAKAGVGAYYATETLQPIGSYYEGTANLPLLRRRRRPLGQDVMAKPEGGCPAGYHEGNLTAGGVSLDTPVCVKPSFNVLHLGVAAVAGFILAKML